MFSSSPVRQKMPRVAVWEFQALKVHGLQFSANGLLRRGSWVRVPAGSPQIYKDLSESIAGPQDASVIRK